MLILVKVNVKINKIMGLVVNLYKKYFVRRFDKEPGVPYYFYTDFPGLKREDYSFNNSRGIEIRYFFYYYDNYQEDKIILLLHGMGPGHAAYLREINELARRGYKVLTLDYQGCGESKGKDMASMNEPTRDVVDLLNHLHLDKEIIIYGHSLGGYTGLHVLTRRKDIKKAIILAGILDAEAIGLVTIKSRLAVSIIGKYEKKIEPEYNKPDILGYLKNTDAEILCIQSLDDMTVPYKIFLGIVEKVDNKHIHIVKVNNRGHNPNYTEEAAKYLSEVFGTFNQLLKKKKIKTDEEKINYFKDVDINRLTEQDQDMFNQIDTFIKERS